ncbi:hypothetical protein [Streptomyces sp. ME18-1-4]|uniref:hypothetical protein n=1 Tax=Streptomyces sp. ME18-1-4 TaxID=3028685 RepID=UPI0029B5A4ED|nr:hypothetical protein [Streptomyces sp. ME18-1-4]MDX3244093.1 hypothetical protein [Streptomyces sp. ME18-1-4]
MEEQGGWVEQLTVGFAELVWPRAIRPMRLPLCGNNYGRSADEWRVSKGAAWACQGRSYRSDL